MASWLRITVQHIIMALLLHMTSWKGPAHGLCAMVHVHYCTFLHMMSWACHMAHAQGLEGSRSFHKEWSRDSNWSGSGEGSCGDSEHVTNHVVVTMITCLVTWRSHDLIWGFWIMWWIMWGNMWYVSWSRDHWVIVANIVHHSIPSLMVVAPATIPECVGHSFCG